MPYIPQDIRTGLADREGARCFNPPINPGELNFVITAAVNRYLHYRGQSYQTINDIVGALESAKLEFYRRIAAPYEDKKREQNGDVY